MRKGRSFAGKTAQRRSGDATAWTVGSTACLRRPGAPGGWRPRGVPATAVSLSAVEAVRTYLELERPTGAPPPADAPAPLDVRRLASPDAAGYRALYAAVGGPYRWRDRDAWSDERLAAHLARPEVAVFTLHDADGVAGYFELERRADAAAIVEVEILYFGLVAAALGRGLGRRLLERALEEAWALGADRVVLNTCTLDHPAALPNYLARGFRVTREERYEVADDPSP
jgi:GNAT superfamily N-acetyltransferase